MQPPQCSGARLLRPSVPSLCARGTRGAHLADQPGVRALDGAGPGRLRCAAALGAAEPPAVEAAERDPACRTPSGTGGSPGGSLCLALPPRAAQPVGGTWLFPASSSHSFCFLLLPSHSRRGAVTQDKHLPSGAEQGSLSWRLAANGIQEKGSGKRPPPLRTAGAGTSQPETEVPGHPRTQARDACPVLRCGFPSFGTSRVKCTCHNLRTFLLT